MRNLPPKSIIAMVHVLALPGSPSYGGSMDEIVDRAIKELKVYEESGVDAIMIENMHDVPYIKPPLPEENVGAMLQVAKEIRKNTQLPVGIQMLEAANLDALSIAHTAGLDFVRDEGFVFAHIGGSGLIEGSAGYLLRKRKELGAEHIKIYADVKKKHCAHALTGDLSVKDVVKQTDFFCADGIIITGGFTGEAADISDLAQAREATELPILIGSGITSENIDKFMDDADGFIIGTYFKEDGIWTNPVDPIRVVRLMEKIRR